MRILQSLAVILLAQAAADHAIAPALVSVELVESVVTGTRIKFDRE